MTLNCLDEGADARQRVTLRRATLLVLTCVLTQGCSPSTRRTAEIVTGGGAIVMATGGVAALAGECANNNCTKEPATGIGVGLLITAGVLGAVCLGLYVAPPAPVDPPDPPPKPPDPAPPPREPRFVPPL
jgi:hypothetical protein